MSYFKKIIFFFATLTFFLFFASSLAHADFPNRTPITFTATNVHLDSSTNSVTFNVNPADFTGFSTTNIDVRVTNVAIDSGWYINNADVTTCLTTGNCSFPNLQQFIFPPGETTIGGEYQIGFFPADDFGQVRWSQVISVPLPPHFWGPITFTVTNVHLDSSTNSVTFNVNPADFTGYPTTNIDVRVSNSEFDSGWYTNNADVTTCLTTGNCSFPNLQQYLLPPGAPQADGQYQIGFFPDGNFPAGKWSQIISVPVRARAYVTDTNQSANDVAVIDLQSGTVADHIPVGAEPRGVVTDPHRNRVYVVNSGAATISVIDALTDTVVDTIPLDVSIGLHAAISPDGTRLYINGGTSGVDPLSATLSVIDTTTDSVIHTVTGFQTGSGNSVVSPDGSKIYYADSNCCSNPTVDGFVYVIDANTYATLAKIEVGLHPTGIDVTPDGSRVYVANASSDTVSVIDTATNTVLHTITTGGPFYTQGVVINSTGTKAYVSNTGAYVSNGTVTVIDTATDTVDTNITVGNNPNYLDISPDDSQVIVANTAENSVSIIKTADNSVTTLSSGFAYPWAVATLEGPFVEPVTPTPTDTPTPTPTNTPTPTPTSTPTPTPTPVNVPPVVSSITVAPNPVQVLTLVTATASFTDANPGDSHTAVADWNDGLSQTSCSVSEFNGSGSVTCPRPSGYLFAKLYSPKITVTDNHGAFGDSPPYNYLSVYNPTPQGLFSGARIFTSPAGADPANPSVTGQVKFGVTAKYQNGVPTGNVSMDFKSDNLTFNAMTITALVTASGKATLFGTGTINGAGNYNFLVTGIDGANDTIRFKITNPANSNAVVYDSQIGAADTADPTAAVTGQVIVH